MELVHQPKVSTQRVDTGNNVSMQSSMSNQHGQDESEEIQEESEIPTAAASYYWNEGRSQNDSVPIHIKLWHWTYWSGSQVVSGMEFTGEILAHFFGLTRSKYHWILEEQEKQQAEEAMRRLEEKQRRQLKLEALLLEEKTKLAAMEQGERNEKDLAPNFA